MDNICEVNTNKDDVVDTDIDADTRIDTTDTKNTIINHIQQNNIFLIGGTIIVLYFLRYLVK